jgi:uncharacterized protein
MSAKNGIRSGIKLYERLLRIDKHENFFLFGPRGTGKSTLLKNLFSAENTLYIDLLQPEVEDEYARNPQILRNKVLALPNSVTHVLIDEVQKAPRLLDVVHLLIEETDKIFVLTGSSARKLKRGCANLLAGRAQVLELYPFSVLETENDFSLLGALSYGCLPKAFTAESIQSKRRFLTAYALTYLNEEIKAEQIVRKIDPFRKFLEVAAQMSGKIVNFASLARDTGADEKTVKSYYQILEDTLIGRYLEPYHTSVRKRLSQKPKFYLFDTGVQRALTHSLNVPLREGTSAYGDLFEIFIVNEFFKLNHYYEKDYSFYYLMTRDGVEIDLVVERPGSPLLLVEIKSASSIHERHLTPLFTLGGEFLHADRICISRVTTPQKHEGNVMVLPWKTALKQIFFC